MSSPSSPSSPNLPMFEPLPHETEFYARMNQAVVMFAAGLLTLDELKELLEEHGKIFLEKQEAYEQVIARAKVRHPAGKHGDLSKLHPW